jgi:hypothetical protein
MAAPIFIAVNQTGSPVVLKQLALTVPAAGQVTLSNYNTSSQIQDDEQLKTLISEGVLLLNDGTNALSMAQSLSYCSAGASPVDLGYYVAASASSGVITGGEVTSTGGAGISVAAGTGLCVRGDPYYDAVKVSWNTTPFPLGNGYYYVYYDLSAGALVATPVARVAEDIQLAQARVDSSVLRFLHKTRTPIYRPSKILDEYLIGTRKTALVSGVQASAGSAGRKFQISFGSYYRSLDEIAFAGTGGDATFSCFYGANGATEVPSQTQVDITNYDNAGTLTSMTAGYWRADSVLVTSDGRISVIYGTAQYATEALAEKASFASIPGMMNSTACTVALLLVQQGNAITKFVDARPVVTTNVAGTSGVTAHSALTGLGADDHAQYLLASGGRAMSGNLDMGGQNVTNVNLLDGVDIPAHVGAGGAAHAAVTTGVNGFMAAADKAKLDLIAAQVGITHTAESDTTITTSSASDVEMTSMSLTIPAGIYLVSFSGDLDHSASNATINTSIWGNGVKYAYSERLWRRGAGQGTVAGGFMCMAYINLTSGQTIKGYWRTSAATATNYRRQLYATKIG